MENNQTLSMKKLISIHEEKLLREIDYNKVAGASTRCSKKQHLLDLEILQKNTTHHQSSQRVLVSIKPRNPSIKTLYIAEKSRFHSKKGSEKSGSRFAIGDHSSFTSQLNENELNLHTIISNVCNIDQPLSSSGVAENSKSSVTLHEEFLAYTSKPSQADSSPCNAQHWYPKQRSAEKCYIYAQRQTNMNLHKIEAKGSKVVSPDKADIATLIITTTSSEDSEVPSASIVAKLNKRIDRLERKILKQEMVFRSGDPNLPLTSLNEESKSNIMRTSSASDKPGCSYIEQYSHVPETSAFQRYAQQATPLSPSKATTLEKEHNSEQYGRDFTTYDGITARGRRQCASVPCKRDGVPKLAAERVHKIRNKLNPVRDYRLMDTVHYLAQGEFAPRDDGIKLTPSREAVLSDIIWEDVCRTHWPSARLGRRGYTERCNDRCTTRHELQRLIDSLLRERVAHVERRRRRHYRIVKLNHRHENCRTVGKTGDIIVASHKNRQASEDVVNSDQNTGSTIVSEKRWEDRNYRRNYRSHDRLMANNFRQKPQSKHDDCCPGPSYAVRTSMTREPTCCYHTSNPTKPETSSTIEQRTHRNTNMDTTSSSGISGFKSRSKKPRLVVKKEISRRKHESREEVNLEHFILLPTLVVRTPSNVKRQKRFTELYHRILNKAHNNPIRMEVIDQASNSNIKTKDIGFNINITVSDSLDQIRNEK